MTFYMNMNKYKYNYLQLRFNQTKISEDIYVLGGINSIKIDITLYSMVTTFLCATKIQEFHCLKSSNEIFHRKSYRCVSKTDSIVVYAKVMNGDMKFGPIKCFLKYIVDLI